MADPSIPPIFQTGEPLQSERFTKKQKRWFFILLILLLLLMAAGAFWYLRYAGEPQAAPVAGEPVPISEPSPVAESIQPENVSTDALFGSAQYESETFKVGDIALGGEAELLLMEDSPEPLEITGVRGEAFTEKGGQEVKLVITWETNKLAKSVVQYAKGAGQTPKTLEEGDYGFSHSMVIPSLDQASTYVYSVTSDDRFGNRQTSDSYAVYTGSKTISLFDLISNALGDVFGWTVKNE